MPQAIVARFAPYRLVYWNGRIHYVIENLQDIPCPFKVYLCTDKGIGGEFVCEGRGLVLTDSSRNDASACFLRIKINSYEKYREFKPFSEFRMPCMPENYCIITEPERS